MKSNESRVSVKCKQNVNATVKLCYNSHSGSQSSWMSKSRRLTAAFFKGRGQYLVVFGLSFLTKAVLLWLFPALYGGDTVLHLRNHQSIILGHQLPALQLLIYLSYKVAANPMAFRYVMIVIASLSATGFFTLCLRFTTRAAAWWAALFFITNPFFTGISTVPYQEILMFGALCFAVCFYADDHAVTASFLLAVACLSRYEAWLACPILLFDHLVRKRWGLRQTITGGLLFCWAPLAWIGCHFSLSSPGNYVVEPPRSILRVVRWIYLGWISAKDTPIPVLAIATVGCFFVYRRLFRDRSFFLFASFIALFLLAILLSAHGDSHFGTHSPELFVSSREATVLVASLLMLAALGMQVLLQKQRWRQLSIWVASVGVAAGLAQSVFLLHVETSQPDVRLSYEAAKFLEQNVGSRDKVLILAKPFTTADWEPYLQKASQLQGQDGLRAARQALRQFDLSPINFQRLAVQCNLPAGHLLSSADLNDVRWLVLWSDYAQPSCLREQLRDFREFGHLAADRLAVTIWKRNNLPASSIGGGSSMSSTTTPPNHSSSTTERQCSHVMP